MKIFRLILHWRQARPRRAGSDRGVIMRAFLAASVATVICSPAALGQQSDPAKPVVVQPGAPGARGAPTKRLPSSTRASLPPRSPADVEFMQGMILHHAQAVEMTAMISS